MFVFSLEEGEGLIPTVAWSNMVCKRQEEGIGCL